MGISCRLRRDWERTLSLTCSDHSASSQPVPQAESLSQAQSLSPVAPRPSLCPHGQDLYLEKHLHCEDLRAGATRAFIFQEVPSPSPLPLTPLYNIPR